MLFPDFQVGWFGELHTIATVLWDSVAERGREEGKKGGGEEGRKGGGEEGKKGGREEGKKRRACVTDLFTINIPFFFPFFLHTLFLHTHTILFALAQISPLPLPSPHTHTRTLTTVNT